VEHQVHETLGQWEYFLTVERKKTRAFDYGYEDDLDHIEDYAVEKEFDYVEEEFR
jgi:hypothetical protein